jgi:hypothetical protein
MMWGEAMRERQTIAQARRFGKVDNALKIIAFFRAARLDGTAFIP